MSILGVTEEEYAVAVNNLIRIKDLVSRKHAEDSMVVVTLENCL